MINKNPERGAEGQGGSVKYKLGQKLTPAERAKQNLDRSTAALAALENLSDKKRELNDKQKSAIANITSAVGPYSGNPEIKNLLNKYILQIEDENSLDGIQEIVVGFLKEYKRAAPEAEKIVQRLERAKAQARYEVYKLEELSCGLAIEPNAKKKIGDIHRQINEAQAEDALRIVMQGPSYIEFHGGTANTMDSSFEKLKRLITRERLAHEKKIAIERIRTAAKPYLDDPKIAARLKQTINDIEGVKRFDNLDKALDEVRGLALNFLRKNKIHNIG